MTLRIKFADGATQESYAIAKIGFDGASLRVWRENRDRPAVFPLHTIAWMELLEK